MRENNVDFWTEASDRFMRRKLKELVKNWQQERKENGLPWSHADLAKELHYSHRNTVSNWLNGKAQPPIDDICKYFNIDPSFFVAQSLEQLDLMDQHHHLWMQNNAAEMAKECGVSNSFLWYLKSVQSLQDNIIDNQKTDAFLNSFDKDVPDVCSPFQFIHSNGTKIYINEYSLPILGRVESEVKEYIQFLLWKEYQKKAR